MIHWRNISKEHLDAQFLFDVEEFLSKSPYDWYVTEAYRSIARSNKLWDEYKHGIPLLNANGSYKRDEFGEILRGKRGPRAAIGGLSAHNYGRAIDVVLDNSDAYGLQPSWDIKLNGWLWLKRESIKHPRLKNGWSFGDWPHIEQYKWKDYTAWRKTYEDNLLAIRNPGLFIDTGLPA